jgi:hypothetical protein
MANPIVKVAGAAIKAVKGNKPVKKVVSRNRQAYDYPVPGAGAKNMVPKMGRKNAQISKNVSIKNAESPSGKQSIRGGAAQVMNQNVRTSIKTNKSEAKANARGLKAANKLKAPKMSKADIKRFEAQIDKLTAEYKAKQKK